MLQRGEKARIPKEWPRLAFAAKPKFAIVKKKQQKKAEASSYNEPAKQEKVVVLHSSAKFLHYDGVCPTKIIKK